MAETSSAILAWHWRQSPGHSSGRVPGSIPQEARMYEHCRYKVLCVGMKRDPAGNSKWDLEILAYVGILPGVLLAST